MAALRHAGYRNPRCCGDPDRRCVGSRMGVGGAARARSLLRKDRRADTEKSSRNNCRNAVRTCWDGRQCLLIPARRNKRRKFGRLRCLAATTGVSWEEWSEPPLRNGRIEGASNSGVVLMETGWPKGHDVVSRPKLVPLKALAQKRAIPGGTEINFAALLATNADRTIDVEDGGSFEISITPRGIKVVRFRADTREEQYSFPGFES